MHFLREEGHFPDPRTTYSSPPSSSCLPFVGQRAKAQRGAVMSQVTQQDRDSSGEFPRGGRLLRSKYGKQFPASIPPWLLYDGGGAQKVFPPPGNERETIWNWGGEEIPEKSGAMGGWEVVLQRAGLGES